MTITALFRKTFIFIFLIIPICFFAQEDEIINEKLPVNTEKLDLIFKYSSITLLNTNTTKVTVGNYGDGKIKKRSGSGSTTKILGITYVESKYKFFIDFINAFNQSSNLTGTKTSSNVLEKIEATMTTTVEPSRSWHLNLRIDKIDFLNMDMGRLTDGERTIKIIRSKMGRFQNIAEHIEWSPETLFYEFIEDGVSLGAVLCEGGNVIWLKPDLDANTKLTVCTAMLAMAG